MSDPEAPNDSKSGDRSPPTPDSTEVTQLLERAQRGDVGAVEQLLPLVYTELRGLARAVFRDQNSSHTLQPTALVHEAFLKMTGKLEGVDGKRHFFVIAGRAMRQVLTDHARSKRADKRGGAAKRVTLHPDMAPMHDPNVDLIDLDESINRLEKVNPRHAKVLEMRLFGGLTVQETAEALGISKRSVDTDWALARAWLRVDLNRDETSETGTP